MSFNAQGKTLTMPPSRRKILDAAEALFARKGFSATSLRDITTAAGVNIASVNYYFGSKEKLIMELLSSAIQPLNAQRIHLLEHAIAKVAPRSPSAAAILEAMIRPCLEMSFDPKREQVFRLLEHSLSEEGNFIKKIIEKEWTPIVTRFVKALQTALPKTPHEELFWRLHFTVGAVIHTSCHWQDVPALSKGRVKLEFEPVLRRLVNFAASGLDAAPKTRKA